MRGDKLPFKCPVCAESYDNLRNLTLHILRLAEWHLKLEGGVGFTRRRNHYEWVENQRIPVKYGPIKNCLEDRVRLGLI